MNTPFRRAFLSGTTTLAAAAAAAGAPPRDRFSPNDRIRIGTIGAGSRVAGTMAAEAFRTGRRVMFDPERLEIV